MLKLLGSAFLLSGGALGWYLQRSERRRRREVLSDVQRALRRMSEGIRMARTPLPQLLNTLASDCGPEADAFFTAASEAAREGEGLCAAWEAQADALPLAKRDRSVLSALGRDLQGDEETVRGAIAQVLYALGNSAGEAERKRPEEEKRSAALWFTAAALLVILLL